MNLRKILRIAIAVEWFLLIAYTTVSYKRTTWVTDVNVVVAWTTGPCILIYIISSAGLFFFKLWAKWTYISLFVFNTVLSFLTEPLSVDRPDMTKVIGALYTITIIFILCMLLFTKVISKKKKLAPPIE